MNQFHNCTILLFHNRYLGKYGTLVDVKIDTSNQVDVQVILRYSDIAGANRAFGAMNGRAFANRKIVAVLR